MTHLNKQLFSVRNIPKQSWPSAKAIIAEHHYSKRAPRNAGYLFMHGLYSGDEIKGVAAWMPPISGSAKSFDCEPNQVLSLSRLVVIPNMPTNSASFLLGRAIRLIKRLNRFKYLVTFADTRFGHTGTIYKATNWEYVGQVKGGPTYVDKHGMIVSVKGGKGSKTRTRSQMESMGYTMLPGVPRHKFIMRLI